MSNYQVDKSNRQTIVLQKDGLVVATFGSLKKVLEYLSEQMEVPSYWTVTRKNYPLQIGEYNVFKVKHF